MYQESAGKIFVKYAFPQMIGLLFNSVYVIVDGVFIGIRLGSTALAAAGLAVPVVELLIALSMAVTSGSGVVVSNRMAVKDHANAVRAFNTCMVLQGIISAAIAVLGNLLIHPLADLLGATEDIHEMTVTYLRYILSLSPFLLFSYLLGGLARNDGRPRLAMLALTIGSLSNILLDYIFMYPLNMGIGGAALATAIGPAVSVSILLPHFIRKQGSLYFERIKPSLSDVRLFLRLGFPSFVMEYSIGMVTFLMNYGIIRYGYGEDGLAAYLIIGYLMLIILTLFLGMAEGLQPAFSYLHAAKDSRKLRSLRNGGIGVFLGIGLAAYVLTVLFSVRFYRIFTPDAEAIAFFAADQSVLYFSGFICAGINILMISYDQATAATGQALLLSSLRGCFLPAALIMLLPVLFGTEALWFCHSLAEVLTVFVCIIIGLRKDHLHARAGARQRL